MVMLTDSIHVRSSVKESDGSSGTSWEFQRQARKGMPVLPTLHAACDQAGRDLFHRVVYDIMHGISASNLMLLRVECKTVLSMREGTFGTHSHLRVLTSCSLSDPMSIRSMPIVL
eukprot:6474475-Amphidinium_carterae.1